MKEHSIEKFVKFAVQRNSGTSFYANEYADNKRDEIVKLSKEPIEKEKMEQLLNEMDLMKLMAVVSNPETPVSFIEDIVEEVSKVKDTSYYWKYKSVMARSILEKVLERDLSEKTLDAILKQHPAVITGVFGAYDIERQPCYRNADTKDVSESNKEKLAKMFMKRKTLRRSAGVQPVRYVKNEEIAEWCLNHPKCDEVTRTAVAKNKNLSDAIRDRAFDEGVDYKDFYADLTPHMVNEVYESVASAYTDGLINPSNYRNIGSHLTSEDRFNKKMFENAMYFLRQMINNNAMTEAVEIDLFNRIADYNSKNTNTVLTALLSNTKSEYIFNNLDRIKHKRDAVYGYANPNIPSAVIDKKIEEYVKKYGGKADMPKYAEVFFEQVGKYHTLPDSIYEYFFNCSSTTYNPHNLSYLIQNCTFSNEYLKKIMEEFKGYTDMPHNRDTRVSIYSMCATSDVFNKYLDTEEKSKMLSCLSLTGLIQRTGRTGSPKKEIFIRDYNSCNGYYFDILLKEYNKIKPEKIKNIKEELKSRIETEKDDYLKNTYRALLDSFFIIEKGKDAAHEFDTKGKNNQEISSEIYKILSKFCNEITENPINLYLKSEEHAKEVLPLMNAIDKSKDTRQLGHYEKSIIDYLNSCDER